MTNVKFKYSEDENGNKTVEKNSKDINTITTRDIYGNVVYDNFNGIERITDYTYDENGNLLSSENNFGTKCTYENGRLINKTNEDYKYDYKYASSELNCTRDFKAKYVNDKLLYDNIEYKFDNNLFKLSKYNEDYDMGDELELTYSSFNGNTKKIEQNHDDYIHKSEYDQNNNLISEKRYKLIAETKCRYDEMNNKIKEEIYNENKDLIHSIDFLNIYDDDNLLVEQNIVTLNKFDL